MSRNNLTRKEQESDENLEVVKNDAPSDRFQNDQQVQNVASALDTKAEKTTFDKKKVSHPGVVVKQDAVSRVLASAPGGEVNAEAANSVSLSYGGNTGVIASSAGYTPKVGQSRSTSRYGKKLDSVINKLNFVPSEQVVVERDESKPIAESHDVQGYNGTIRNAAARAQKNNGGVPAATMFQRSLDEISRDQLYFCAGQTVKNPNVQYADTPTLSAEADADGVYGYPSNPNYLVKRGNYLPRKLTVGFKKGELTDFHFEVLDVSTEVDDATVANDSSTAELRHINRCEVARQNMDANAGDEKAEIWSPLPRAIRQPSETVAFLNDIEGDTGDEVFMAYKKTALALSYQLNRAAKDGLDVVGPMHEALTGLILHSLDSQKYAGIDPFDTRLYSKGASSIMIAAFDSTTKYTTKADLLMLPKSFKQFMQIADNNMNPLRVHKEFVQCVNNREVFSTIDRPYDPLLPVCISDREALIHPYDWSKLYDITDKTVTGPFRYMYHDLRNVYTVTVAHPLLEGIAEYFKANASSFCKALGVQTGQFTIPIIHSTRFFSTWSLVCLAATPYIIRSRINSMRDILYYEKNVEYPFSDLVRISDANPMNAVNYQNGDYQAPIVVGQMMPSTAVTWQFPELFWPIDEEASNDQYVALAPWYMNEVEYKFGSGKPSRAEGEHAITLPSIRSGIRLAAADNLYSMSERDLRLCLDRITYLPPSKESDSDKNGVYKYDQMSDGIPVFNWGTDELNVKVLLSLPRELGYFMVAPYGLLTPKAISGTKSFDPSDLIEFASEDALVIGSSSYLAKMWLGFNGNAVAKKGTANILKNSDINVNRSTAYIQRWIAADCSRDGDTDNLNAGFVLSLGDIFDNDLHLIDNEGAFIPFTTGTPDSDNGGQKVQVDAKFKVVSLQKALWTRIQVLPFVISPWDVASVDKTITEDSVKVDPFDLAYAFGFCGFRASDYAEDVYNHDNMIVNMGLTFLDDPWVLESPIFKESVRLTQA